MAKRANPPPTPTPAPAPDELDDMLLDLAEMILADHFFDPDAEAAYKRARRPKGSDALLLESHMVRAFEGEAELRIEALSNWQQLRVVVSHADFTAAVEGIWNFDNETFTRPKITRQGDAETIETEIDFILASLEGDEGEEPGEDDDEFADFLNSLDDDEDDEDEQGLIGDDPTEPPEVTPLERNRLKSIAKRIARSREGLIDEEDRDFLADTPQTLPVITDSLVAAALAAKQEPKLIVAWTVMLGLQLEFVRYRQDRGWDWADSMLNAFIQRLVALGKEKRIPPEVYFEMCGALTSARVPVSDEVSAALADAGFKPEEMDETPEEMLHALRAMMEEMSGMVTSPYQVQEALMQADAMLPVALRGFMATEFALSSHPVLRETTPLYLLDDDATVREAAASALEQTAQPGTVSPDTLRRAIALRNWIPASTRPRLDAAIRKARLAGIEIAPWPAAVPDLEYHASIVDGSGAQSLLIASRSGRKGIFAGVLFRHGAGVLDAWIDVDMTRGKIGKMLKEAREATAFTRVDQRFANTMIQYALAASVQAGTTPPAALLQLAEASGGAEWREQAPDFAAEAERLFEALEPAAREADAIETTLEDADDWMADSELFDTWFEDSPEARKLVKANRRKDEDVLTGLVLERILPQQREVWAQRFLLMALWCQASTEAAYRKHAAEMTVTARELIRGRPLEEIPPMAQIALTTVEAANDPSW